MQNKQTDTVTLDVDELPVITDNEQEFLRLMLQEGMTATAAYRLTHDCTDRTDKSVHGSAYNLKGSARIQAWISAYRRIGAFNAIMSQAEYLHYLIELGEEARKAGNYGAAVSAANLVGKTLGHAIDRSEVTHRKSETSTLLEQWEKAQEPAKPDIKH